ncbi:MAG: hypothetical protein Q8R25_00195 [bacterium]|nr:hypothetical protein [bacterium]
MRGPLFFFGGPIGGGGDFQYEMYKKCALHLDEDFCAAIPIHYPHSHPLAPLRLPSHGHFPRQLPWERYYLEEAGIFRSRGCIVFYFPVESITEPRADGLPYAMDSRGEIGEWRGRMMYESRIRLVIGADRDFPGLDVIARNFDKALGGTFKIHKSLDETVEAALKKVSPDERVSRQPPD